MYNVWENVLAEIKQKVSDANYSTWFQDTSLISADNGNIIIGVKNSFHIKQLTVKFSDIIKDALKKNNVEVKTIDYEVKTNSKPRVRSREVTTGDIVKETVSRPKRQTDSAPHGLNSKYT